MASITTTGIGSGLDVASLVQQLVAAEQQPTELRIARREAQFQGELSAYGSVKSALSGLKDQLDKMNELDSLLKRSVSVSDETILELSADESALPGSYEVEVEALAQAQQLQSAAFTGADATVGTGTLTISVGGASFSVTIDESANTLADVQDGINRSLNNTGVSASIVNADTGSYLFLSGQSTGSDQTIRVTQSGGDGGLSVLEYDPANQLDAMTEAAAAQDALVRINGFEVTSDNNTVVGAIDGVTIDLLTTNVGEPTRVSVSDDGDAVKAEITAFVEAYNEVVSTLDSQTAYDIETKQGAPLLGDATVRSVRDQLRRELSVIVGDADASFNSLLNIGIETNVDGELEIDDTRLNSALASDFSKIGQLFANPEGYALRLGAIVDSYVDGSEAVLNRRLDEIEGSIDDLTDQREALGERLVSLEARLLKQFNALDTLVGELTSTSNFLTQQLASLPSVSGPGQ